MKHQLTKRIGFKSLKVLFFGLLLMIWLVPFTCSAETGSVIIATDTSFEVGDKVTVTVKYTASTLGLIDGELRYDPDMLKFISGGTSSDSAAGVIKMNKQLNGEKEQLFTIRFEAVGSGSDFFLVNTFQLKDKESTDLGKPGASVKLIVTETPTQPVVDDPATTPEDPIDVPEAPIVDPATETPATIEQPVTDEENKMAPNTLWVFVGAITATTFLIVISLIVVYRKKKSD